jgi:nucleotide-binding universal stress UspA family protein
VPDMIVVPIDGSELSARAIPIAAVIARASGAGIRLVGVARDETELAWMYDRVHDAKPLVAAPIPEAEVLVGGDPEGRLLELASDSGNVLCFASHDHVEPVAALLHSVGSHLIERATEPLLVVGPNANAEALAGDVVVALDGVGDPEPLLSAASAWARRLGATLRIVTVYEPVPADLRTPDHFTRSHAPGSDPDVYLQSMHRRVVDAGLAGVVDAVAIPDPVSVAAGLVSHLEDPAAFLLVVGGRVGAHVTPGVLRELLQTVALPVLVVNRQGE